MVTDVVDKDARSWSIHLITALIKAVKSWVIYLFASKNTMFISYCFTIACVLVRHVQSASILFWV